jgi:hypothetical protein
VLLNPLSQLRDAGKVAIFHDCHADPNNVAMRGDFTV